MRKLIRLCLLTVAFSVAAPAAQAYDGYGQEIGTKLGAGASNIVLCWLELPKNVLKTTNDANVALGITGGIVKGILHMVGRTLTGVVDVLSFPVPTYPIAEPQFIWQNFDVETHYNPLFKLKQGSAERAPVPGRW